MKWKISGCDSITLWSEHPGSKVQVSTGTLGIFIYKYLLLPFSAQLSPLFTATACCHHTTSPILKGTLLTAASCDFVFSVFPLEILENAVSFITVQSNLVGKALKCSCKQLAQKPKKEYYLQEHFTVLYENFSRSPQMWRILFKSTTYCFQFFSPPEIAQLFHLYHYKMMTKAIYETSHQENILQYIKINLPINKLKLKLPKSQIKDSSPMKER